MTKKAQATFTPSYITSPCDRCGSPKIIGKTWKETIETFNGKSVIEHTQILCSDKECQKMFEKALAEELKKKEAARAGRNDAFANKTAAAKSSKSPAERLKN